MESRNLLPQNTRLMANLLSFSGGALDVFCHMYYHSLVATQTGNIHGYITREAIDRVSCHADWEYPFVGR